MSDTSTSNTAERTARNFYNRTTELIAGGEISSSIGRIAFKTTQDLARGNRVCASLCLASITCETIAFGYCAIKILPFRGKVYVGAKIISKGCMTFRNLAAGEV